MLYLQASLLLTLYGKKQWYSQPGRFILEEKSSATHSVCGWVGPKACLSALEKVKLLSVPGIEPRIVGR
jgi:hypothetical protein